MAAQHTSGSATNLVDLLAGNSPFTWSHTAVNNACLFVFIGTGINPAATGDCVTSVTYNGINLTKKQFTGDGGNAWSGVQLWEYHGTVDGTQTIAVNYNQSGIDWFACAISMDADYTISGVYTNTNTTSNPSVYVGNVMVAEYVIGFQASDESINATTEAANLIAEAEDVGSDNDFNGQWDINATADPIDYTMSWTRTTSANEWWVAMAAVLTWNYTPPASKNLTLLGVG
jgi:hypothetical protein